MTTAFWQSHATAQCCEEAIDGVDCRGSMWLVIIMLPQLAQVNIMPISETIIHPLVSFPDY